MEHIVIDGRRQYVPLRSGEALARRADREYTAMTTCRAVTRRATHTREQVMNRLPNVVAHSGFYLGSRLPEVRIRASELEIQTTPRLQTLFQTLSLKTIRY